MKKFFLIIITILVSINVTFSQGTFKDYKRAEKFLHFNMSDLVQNLYLSPNWIDETSNFWYKTDTEGGYQFKLILTDENVAKLAFDHHKLAKVLGKELDIIVHPDSLPFSKIDFKNNLKTLIFNIDSLTFKYDIKKNILSKNNNKKNGLKKNESKSPDGKWIAFVKNYNLYLRDVKTEEEFQLTTDGVDHFDYASPISWYKNVDESVGDIYDPRINVKWSPGSKKFMAISSDRRNAKKLYLYQSLPKEGMRAKVWSYERGLPGDNSVAFMEFYIFDVEKKTNVKVDVNPFNRTALTPEWTDDGSGFYFTVMERFYKSIDLYYADPETGEVNNIIHEDANTMIEFQMAGYKLINNGEKVIWKSERDGWSHLYLYDGKTGTLINQITKGEFVVLDIVYSDDKNEIVYFMASGKEKGRDPYFKHLYKINFDGTGMTLLTPEDAEHEIHVSPDFTCFVDNYSRVDLKPKSLLRRLSDGELIRELHDANIDKLLATGWRYPERFTVKGRDGITDLYGILKYPSNFDTNIKYPIINSSYTGPSAYTVPKSFRQGIFNDFTPLAEVGFIVMRIDGMGTAMRSKAFHDVSYMNLGDIGALDHIGAIKQLAEKNAFIDTNKV